MCLRTVWRVYQGASLHRAGKAAQVHPVRVVCLLDEARSQSHCLLESPDLLADSFTAITHLTASLLHPVHPDPAFLLVQALMHSK